MSKNIVFNIYKFSCLILVLSSMKAYFLWNIHIVFLYLFSILMWFLCSGSFKKCIHFKTNFLIPIFLLFILDLFKSEFLPIKTTLLCIFIAQILSFSDEKRQEILKFCGTGFAVVLLVSLIGFILSLILPIPSFGYLYYEGYDFRYENYLFFLRIDSITRGLRFTSVFLEPGHVGMICALFLFAYKYRIKEWTVVVFLISLLFTLSLAGYFLLVIGYVLYSLNQHGVSFLKKVLIGVILLGSGYFTAIEYNGGNNVVNNFIIERLQYDEDEGIVGNNRTDDATRQLLQKNIGKEVFWFGYSTEQYDRLRSNTFVYGAGWIVFIFQYGVWGIFLVSSFYLILAFQSANKKIMLLMLLLYAICFIQRAYPLWVAWLIPYLGTMQINVKVIDKVPYLRKIR